MSLRGRRFALAPRSIGSDTILELIPDAAIIVTADGVLVRSNSAAEELLASGELRKDLDRLRSGPSATLSSLASAVAKACNGSGEAASAFVIDRPDGPPTIAAVMPCRLFDGAPHALLLLPWPGRRNGTVLGLLQRLFKLTRSEAEICQAVGDGLTLGAIAERRGVAVGTVRAQLKAGAAKLGCTRQAQIALLLRRIGAIGAAAPADRPR